MSNIDNKSNSFEDLMPYQRLEYLIKKYFKSQKDFADKAKIQRTLANKYINNQTQKFSLQILMKIEANIGFSSKFIREGTGNELVDDCKLKPLIAIKNAPAFSKQGENAVSRQQQKQQDRGESQKATLIRWGATTKLTENSIGNIVDVAFNGIGNTLMVIIADEVFSVKYEIKMYSTLVLDVENYTDGNIVLVESQKQHYLCKYTKEALIDIDKNIGTREDINKEAKIEGAVYCKIEKL